MSKLIASVPESVIHQLAREVAMDLDPLETILENCKLTVKQYDAISKLPFFTRVLGEQLSYWRDPANGAARVRVLQERAFEMSIPEIFALIHDRTQTPTARVEAFKALQKGAGAFVSEKSETGAEKVQITINMGDQRVTREISAPVLRQIDHSSSDGRDSVAGDRE
jgi:hypothetical protein